MKKYVVKLCDCKDKYGDGGYKSLGGLYSVCNDIKFADTFDRVSDIKPSLQKFMRAWGLSTIMYQVVKVNVTKSRGIELI